MGSVYEARLRNARKVGERLQRLVDEGYMVLDEESQIIGKIEHKGFGDAGGLSIGNVVYMHDDPECDNGLELTVKEFNALFSTWRAVHPRHQRRVL